MWRGIPVPLHRLPGQCNPDSEPLDVAEAMQDFSQIPVAIVGHPGTPEVLYRDLSEGAAGTQYLNPIRNQLTRTGAFVPS